MVTHDYLYLAVYDPATKVNVVREEVEYHNCTEYTWTAVTVPDHSKRGALRVKHVTYDTPEARTEFEALAERLKGQGLFCDLYVKTE